MKIIDNINLINTKTSRNRIVMPPMDTLMSTDGFANDFHIQHYGARSYGGVGTIIVECTSVLENGRIRPADLGIWKDEHIENLKRVSSIIKMGGAVSGIQLAHAGAKAELSDIKKYGTSTEYFQEIDQSNMVVADQEILDEIVEAYVQAAKRAKLAGFDFIEIHAAHGYFLSSLISRHTNHIFKDKDIVTRSQPLIDILNRITNEVSIPIGIRISFSDHVEDGMELNEYKPLIEAINQYVDYIHVSSGTFKNIKTAEMIKDHKLFRVEMASEVKKWTNKNIIVVGLFHSKEDVEYALEQGIDAVALGRELLFNPNFVLTQCLDIEDLNDSYKWNDNSWFNYKSYLYLKNKFK
ncbi:MAG: hypothetical protein ACRC42_01395 [Mycoplasma sp.]